MQPEKSSIRKAAVAGRFYPADPGALRSQIEAFLSSARTNPAADRDECTPSCDQKHTVKAVIAPHAGYPYSGPVAGSAIAALQQDRALIKRIVLLGPSHRIPFKGIALSSATAFKTPLGEVPIDRDFQAKLQKHASVSEFDAAHEEEHCIEVLLPFLQVALQDFHFVPMLVCDMKIDDLADVLEMAWDDDETRIVISSDLSHYLPYAEAKAVDENTAGMIKDMDHEALESFQACGCRPIRGLLRVAGRHHMRCRVLDLRNSGDTAGSKDRVVGYGAFAFQ